MVLTQGSGQGCPRARDSFGTLWPLPESTTCSFPYRFSRKSRNSALVPGDGDPNLGVALEQEAILGLSGPCPKRILVPSHIDFQEISGVRALYQAIGIPTLDKCALFVEVLVWQGPLGSAGSLATLTRICNLWHSKAAGDTRTLAMASVYFIFLLILSNPCYPKGP